MRNLLQVDFLGGLHVNAEGIVAIAAAVLIVISVCRPDWVTGRD
jgi:hypothetical protein